jgi:thiol-disulfide isomerase/thioredoxin
MSAPGSALNRPPHIFWPVLAALGASDGAEFGLGLLAMAVSQIITIGNAIKVMVLLGVFAVIGVCVQSCKGPQDPLAAYSTASLKKLTTLERPPARPALTFQTLDGQAARLSDYDGKVVLMNAWATWCPPCIAEMPSLDRLQGLRGGPDFVVVPISLDRTALEAKLWLEKNDIENLESWHDGSFELTGKVKLPGLPTSIFYSREGREIARIPGEVEWDSPEALALIDKLIMP